MPEKDIKKDVKEEERSKVFATDQFAQTPNQTPNQNLNAHPGDITNPDVVKKAHEEAKPKEGDKPEDPLKNFQEVQVKQRMEVNQDVDAVRRTNMNAKQQLIEDRPTLTTEEAAKLAQGMDAAKTAEIQSKVVDDSKDSVTRISDRRQKTLDLIGEIVGDTALGRNATRNQLREIRQAIQEIEKRMDQGIQ